MSHKISLMAKRPCPGWSHGVRGRGSNAVLEVPALEQCSLVQPRGAAARGGLGQWPLAKSDMPEGTPEMPKTGGRGPQMETSFVTKIVPPFGTLSCCAVVQT